MPVSALIIFALFVQIAASNFCEVKNESIDKEFGHFSCYPELNEEQTQACPLTVCILQCKNSPLRYKHHCGSDGRWDIAPGSKSCVQCKNQQVEWPDWYWSCSLKQQHLIGSQCLGTCKYDNKTQLSTECQKNGEWRTPNNLNTAIATCKYFFEHVHEDPDTTTTTTTPTTTTTTKEPTTTEEPTITPETTAATETTTATDTTTTYLTQCESAELQFPNWNFVCSGSQSGLFDCNGTCIFDNQTHLVIECQNGEWNLPDDADAIIETCENFEDPEAETLCPDFDIKNGEMYCVNRTCVLDCDVGYVPSSEEILICSLKAPIEKIYHWTTLNGLGLQNLSLVSCERPLAVIAGGLLATNPSVDSLELYHPSREFTITLPDLPSQLSKQELSGLWLHGMLMFCGMKITNYDPYFTCFELKKNEDSAGYYWEENEHSKIYLSTTQVSMLRPEKSWEFYAIGGNDKFSTSVRIYDLVSQGQPLENTEAFLEGDLYAHSCAFNIDNTINVFGKDHIYQHNIYENSYGPWQKIDYEMNLDFPKCLKTSNENTILVMDRLSNVYLFRNGFFQKITSDFRLEESMFDFELTILDGQPTMIGGNEIIVKQLSISDDMILSTTSATNQLSQKRRNFCLVEVPISFFEEFEN